MKIVLFGANNPSGAAFVEIVNANNSISLEVWGRNPPSHTSYKYVQCDLLRPFICDGKNLSGIIVSFAPIWLLATFLESIQTLGKDALTNIEGMVVCSSSSYLTKRFSYNTYDQELAQTLVDSHRKLASICGVNNIPCQILAPSLVYGNVGQYKDKNINKIVDILRHSPFILIPRRSGLRQPIHAFQLAKAAHVYALRLTDTTIGYCQLEALGGDTEISYLKMVGLIQANLAAKDTGRRCKVIEVPNRLFYALAALLLPINPKMFEALLRIQSNLSGFTKCHEILGESPQEFPIGSIQ